MNYSFEYIDIILLAMIAGFIFLRLRGILGKRTGFEGKAPTQFDKILKEAVVKQTPKQADIFDEEAQKEFLKGARIAYETIITDFSDNDNKITTSKPLLNKDIYSQFNEALKERNSRGHFAEITFIGINSAEIKEHKKVDKILNVIPKLKPVEGRFEKIGKIKNQSKVILDYAHTPDALKTCLLNLREQFPNKAITVLFGCGGNRDQNKRSKMGKIASDFADSIILTNDNPRFENPQKIRRDIKKGIKKKRITEISNRAIAIKKAIHNLN